MQMTLWYAVRTMSHPERLQTEELSAPVDVLAQQFVQRWDKYPRQGDNGAYFTVENKLTRRHLYSHLRGKITLGSYVLDPESCGRFMVLDADDAPGGRRLQALAQVLGQLDCQSYLEASRRGGHLWFFFDEPLPGREIRRFGKGLLAHFNIPEMELYPKQDALRSGPGSLIRMPFGVHRKSGRRYGFYTSKGEPLAPTLREQISVLGEAETVPERLFDLYSAYASAPAPKPDFEPIDAPGELVSDRIKAATSCYEFISQYVELDDLGRGHCPFHDDQTASFSIHREHNYWHCFSGCGAGDVISFYMTYQQRVEGKECDFKAAVTDLAGMLLK